MLTIPYKTWLLQVCLSLCLATEYAGTPFYSSEAETAQKLARCTRAGYTASENEQTHGCLPGIALCLALRFLVLRPMR